MAGRYEEESVDAVVPNTSGGGAKKFKFDADKKYRIGFPRFRKTESGDKVSIIKVGYFKFNEELKKSFLLTDDTDLNNKCIPIMGQPVYRFATPIVVYKTDVNGVLVSPPAYDVVPFVFADDTMKQLQDINAEWDLTKVDVFVRIKEKTDVKMQNITITPTKEAMWLKGEKAKSDIIAKAAEVAAIQHTAVAIDAEPAQIRKWLSFDEVAGSSAESSEAAGDWAETPASEAEAGGDGSVPAGDIDGWC